MAAEWMPREGMNNRDDSKPLHRLTAFLRALISARSGLSLSNLSANPSVPSTGEVIA